MLANSKASIISVRLAASLAVNQSTLAVWYDSDFNLRGTTREVHMLSADLRH